MNTDMNTLEHSEVDTVGDLSPWEIQWVPNFFLKVKTAC